MFIKISILNMRVRRDKFYISYLVSYSKINIDSYE